MQCTPGDHLPDDIHESTTPRHSSRRKVAASLPRAMSSRKLASLFSSFARCDMILTLPRMYPLVLSMRSNDGESGPRPDPTWYKSSIHGKTGQCVGMGGRSSRVRVHSIPRSLAFPRARYNMKRLGSTSRSEYILSLLHSEQAPHPRLTALGGAFAEVSGFLQYVHRFAFAIVVPLSLASTLYKVNLETGNPEGRIGP
jgi:hypothetical protein